MRRGAPTGVSGSGRRGRHALFWKVFTHGLLVIVLVVFVMGVVAHVFRTGWWWEAERVARYATERVSELQAEPAALQVELGRVREAFGLVATVYAPDARTVVASSADPPLPPVLAPGTKDPRGFPFGRHGRALPLLDGGQAVFRLTEHPPGPWFLLAALAAIALASVPFARSIARPMEELTRAARKLGGGDLSTRARVRARGEVGELARAFDEMAERIEAQVRAEKELLANVSHEVRTPLARIRVALELAAEGDLERARRFLGEIGSDLDELDRLVEDVLSAARLDLAVRGGNGTARIARAAVDVRAVVADAARRFSERWPARTLELDVAKDLPGVAGDAALLRRLLDNLLDNAAKYSDPPAPVRLGAHAGTGAVAADGGASDGATSPADLVLEVRDEGIGIAPEDVPRLFTPFFRTDRSRARQSGGFGLGLALARRIARAHGGDIEVESEEDRGTVFRVRVPV